MKRPRSNAAMPMRWGVLGVKRTFADDFTFHCLDMSWPYLLLLVFGVYLTISCLFAAAFWMMTVSTEHTRLFPSESSSWHASK